MKPADLAAGRAALGLSAANLGRALELEARDPGRSVRDWETGRTPIPGPVRVAVRLMLEAQAREKLQDALQTAQAILTPQAPAPAALEPPEAIPPHPPHTRRRG